MKCPSSSIPQQPGSPVGCRKMDTCDCSLRVEANVLEAFVRLFCGAVGPDFTFMDDNMKSHRAYTVNDFLEG